MASATRAATGSHSVRQTGSVTSIHLPRVHPCAVVAPAGRGVTGSSQTSASRIAWRTASTSASETARSASPRVRTATWRASSQLTGPSCQDNRRSSSAKNGAPVPNGMPEPPSAPPEDEPLGVNPNGKPPLIAVVPAGRKCGAVHGPWIRTCTNGSAFSRRCRNDITGVTTGTGSDRRGSREPDGSSLRPLLSSVVLEAFSRLLQPRPSAVSSVGGSSAVGSSVSQPREADSGWVPALRSDTWAISALDRIRCPAPAA